MVRFFILLWVVGITQTWGQATNFCEPLIRRYEVTHGIPHKLLTAISVVESGRKMGGGYGCLALDHQCQWQAICFCNEG
jgi:hypothetical protein